MDIFHVFFILFSISLGGTNVEGMRKLKMVNIINRHAERPPVGDSLRGDLHKEVFDNMWPNGPTALTDMGIFRAFRIGLQTRADYDEFLGYDSRHVLAYSSPEDRCIQTIQFILRGLYNNEDTISNGKLTVAQNCPECLPDGSGFGNEYLKVEVDSETLPTLSFSYAASLCNLSLTQDISGDEDVESMPGIKKLKDTVKSLYASDLTILTSSNIMGNIKAELNIRRTKESLKYTSHYADWINEPVLSDEENVMKLYNVFEEESCYAFAHSIEGRVKHAQFGPVLRSFIDSQKIALGYPVSENSRALYNDTRLIFYGANDVVIFDLLYYIGVIPLDTPFESRFFETYEADMVDKLLAAVKLPYFGSSARFETWQLELKTSHSTFSIVEVSIYNEEDAKFGPILYKPIALGSVCRRIFMKKYPFALKELEGYYDMRFFFDESISCPFELWLNITSDLVSGDEDLQRQCL